MHLIIPKVLYTITVEKMELFQLVDERGNPTGQATRGECHGNPSLIHLVIRLYLFDSSGRLLLQKRALTKDTMPGRWDASVGGHVMAGESAENALLRETREEIGVDAAGARPLFGWLHHNGGFETEFARVFTMIHDGEFRVDPEEIQEGRLFSMKEIEGMLGRGILTPMFEHELPKVRRAIEA
jgi:isopentenyl-diphosphate delta-isomerase type 1